jgi:hypothetical protein
VLVGTRAEWQREAVEDEELAEAWVQERLAIARITFETEPAETRDASLRESERLLRGLAWSSFRPTAQYVGLTVDAAQELAAAAAESLCVHRGPTGHRANWEPQRVHVEVGPDELITRARRDRPMWRPLDQPDEW